MAAAGLRATISLAGRVRAPAAQALPSRVGGFGGVAGLVAYLRDNAITHVVDATHPFADVISRNAIAACAQTGLPLMALTRAPWRPQPGDRWTHVPDLAGAVAALSGPARRVMLAVGRQPLPAFAAQPQHFYLLRLVDPPDQPPPLPNHHIIIARGPFEAASDAALLREHRIEVIVAKNAGGSGASAKLTAARQLGLPVIMIDRPAIPPRAETERIEDVLRWLGHAGTERGV